MFFEHQQRRVQHLRLTAHQVFADRHEIVGSDPFHAHQATHHLLRELGTDAGGVAAVAPQGRANVTVVAAAFSLLFALGDCLPPSRIVGRTAIETVGYRGSYASFLKATAVPWVVMGVTAVGMLIFANRLSFLVRY